MMIKNFLTTWQIAKSSFQVLRLDKELILLSLSAAILIFTSLVVGIFLVYVVVILLGRNSVLDAALAVGLVIYGLLVITCVTVLHGSIVAAAYLRFTGENPTLRDGLAVALPVIIPLFTWTVLIVGIQALLGTTAKNNASSKAVTQFTDFAWGTVSTLVLPVILIENKSVTESIKRSIQLFRATWGTHVVSKISWEILGSLFVAPLVLIIFLILYWGGTTEAYTEAAIVIAALILFGTLVGVVLTTLVAIFTAALYVYASKSIIPVAFNYNIKEIFTSGT